MRRKSTLVICIIGLATAGLITRLILSTEAPVPVEITFLGLDNSAGAVKSVFRVQNALRREITIELQGPETFDGSQWIKDPRISKSFLRIQPLGNITMETYLPQETCTRHWRVPAIVYLSRSAIEEKLAENIALFKLIKPLKKASLDVPEMAPIDQSLFKKDQISISGR